MSGTATVVLLRSKQWFGLFRTLNVLVDGVKSAYLESGEAVKLEVSCGRHSIQTKMDWCSSNSLEIDCYPEKQSIVACDSAPALLALLYIVIAPSKVFRVCEVKTIN